MDRNMEVDNTHEQGAGAPEEPGAKRPGTGRLVFTCRSARGRQQQHQQQQQRANRGTKRQQSLSSVFGGGSDEVDPADIALAATLMAGGEATGGGQTFSSSTLAAGVTGGRGQVATAEGREQRVQQLKEEGNRFADQGDYRSALHKFEEAIGLSPKDAVLYELKAQAHIQLEEFFEATKAAAYATEIAPTWLDAKVTLGRARLSFGEIRGAVDVLTEVCGKDPSNAEARDDLIYANQQLMELVRREQDFELQMAGRAGLTHEEQEVARAKRHLLSRGAGVDSDCTYGRVQGGEGGRGPEEDDDEYEEGGYADMM